MIDFKVGRQLLDPVLLKSLHWCHESVVASLIFILQKCWLECILWEIFTSMTYIFHCMCDQYNLNYKGVWRYMQIKSCVTKVYGVQIHRGTNVY